MVPKKGYTKATIGGPEETSGVSVARTARIPITNMAYVQETPSKSTSEIITGRNTNGGYGVDAIEYACELATAMGASKAFSMLLQSCMGRASKSVQVGGSIGIAYVGASESCKLVVTASDIKSYVGEYGKEILDKTFGTNGTLLLSGTIEGLMTTINGYSDYEAYLIAGNGLVSVADAVPIVAAQAKNHGVPVWFASANSGAYLHSFKPNNTRDENPTYSVQFDGVGRNEIGVGALVNTAAFSGDLKAKMAVTWSLVLLGLETTITESTLGLGDNENDCMKFSEGNTYIAGKKICYIKNISLNVTNNVSADDGWCQGKLTKNEHFRGVFGVTGSVTVTLTENTQLQADTVISNEITSLQTIYLGRNLTENLKSMLLFDIATLQYMSYSKSANDATIDLSLELEAVDSNAYDDFFEIQMLCDFE